MKARDLPSGTVTFLFTDVEGSTQLLKELGADAFAAALAEHRRVVRAAIRAHGGVEVDTQGDSFFVAFSDAPAALQAAKQAQEGLAQGPIRVRMGIHTGTALGAAEGYVGIDVHRAARISAAGHGGQVLVSGATVDVTGTHGLRELGEHRLKDFDDPVSLYQLGDGRFPPLRTISNTNLPHPSSSFVGREGEVTEIAALMRKGVRLVTLTGPGGTGKTRLAIEAATTLVPDFKAGVFWVGLAPLRDPALVIDTIRQALGAKDGLADHIGERELLLLLDNLEQVVEVAPGLASLVEACPNLTLLVTSRELLRVRGEVEFAVRPLAEPDAVELFCARAAVEPGDVVHQLCRALDNLPLALELAAARASVLSPPQILERLSERLDLLKGGRDADPRQRTLRATIGWSYELLNPEEQRLFARLSVFRGGFTFQATEEVAGADVDTLQSLVDKSLLLHTADRFAMLETVRDYAAEQLEASGETDDVRRLHAEHFLALAEEAEPHLRGSPRAWLDRLEAEHDNLRAALDRFEAMGESELAMRLAGSLARFWSMRSRLAEGRRRLESALRGDERPTAVRATALDGAALIALGSGDVGAARAWADEALALHQRYGDAWGVAHSGFLLAYAAALEDRFLVAQPLFDASARAFRGLGDEHYTLLAMRNLAWMYYELGDRGRARSIHQDVVQNARALGNQRMAATSLGALAEYALDDGDVQEALPMLKEATRIDHGLGESAAIALNLSRFARILAVERRPADAVRLLSRADALNEESGATFDSFAVRQNEQTLVTVSAQLREGAVANARVQGRAMTVDEAVALALEA